MKFSVAIIVLLLLISVFCYTDFEYTSEEIFPEDEANTQDVLGVAIPSIFDYAKFIRYFGDHLPHELIEESE